MKLKSLIALLTLSLAMWAQTGTPAPKKEAPASKAAAGECACCQGMAKDHTCADCCKGGKCEMKDGASCPMMKDAKACMGKDGCCAGMKHDDTKHDNANASTKPGVTSDGKMGAHCPMMAGKDGKKGGCGMCGGGTDKANGK